LRGNTKHRKGLHRTSHDHKRLQRTSRKTAKDYTGPLDRLHRTTNSLSISLQLHT